MYVSADGDARIYLCGSNGVISSTGQHYVGSNVVWNAGNDGSGSGLDADTLDGAQPSVSASNSTIVQRHSSGYIFANYFNTTPNDVTSGVTKVCVETGNDGYIRHGSAAAIRTFINVENGATADQTASEILTAIKTVDGSGSGLDADNLDGYTWTSGTNATFSRIEFSGQGGNSGNGVHNYAIYQEGGAWSSPYPDLVIGYHTGIKIGGHYSYNGTRFYNDAPGRSGASEIMSVGNGDSHVRVINNLYAPIFYDSNNTAYYMDPASTSVMNEILVGDGTVRLRDATGNYGSLECVGGGTGGWEGFSIGGRIVFMHNNSTASGLYNDINNEWMVNCENNSYVRLYHNGSTKLETTSGGVSITGDLTATGNVTAYSDERLKKNIKKIENAIDKIEKLNGVEFEWKENNKKSIGVIAQNVEKVLPELVEESETEILSDEIDPETLTPYVLGKETYKHVAYGNMVGLLIEAIKEQQRDINNLKQIITGLKNND